MLFTVDDLTGDRAVDEILIEKHRVFALRVAERIKWRTAMFSKGESDKRLLELCAELDHFADNVSQLGSEYHRSEIDRVMRERGKY